MKQAITQKQWDELTTEQHEKYITWTVQKSQEAGDYTTVYRSIGHLIWFLDDHQATTMPHWNGGFLQKGEFYTNHGVEWCVGLDTPTEEKYHYGVELVDALWQAVKDVLSNMVEVQS